MPPVDEPRDSFAHLILNPAALLATERLPDLFHSTDARYDIDELMA